MPFHHWGDEWFEANGNALNEAISQIMRDWQRWGRICTHGKEKYGTFRHHVYFYDGSWPIHALVKPGHVCYRWPNWAYRIEFKLGLKVRAWQLHRPIQWWQGKVYNWAIQRACRRWPQIADELVAHADAPDLIRGKVDGIQIHNKYWKSFG